MCRRLYSLPMVTALQSLTRAPRTIMISWALLGRETTSESLPRFVSPLFALSLAPYLARLAPCRCGGHICLRSLAYNSATLSIRPCRPHGATACMGDMLTGMFNNDDSTSQTRRQDYNPTHTSLSPLSGVVIQHLRTHLVDMSVITLTT
jgi:hypothetical protein